MSDINNVTLVGRLTRDAELRYTNTGTAICNISLAVNSKKKTADGWMDEANYFDVTLWGKSGESLSQYLLKGKQIAVNGELKQSRWNDKDGQTRSKVNVNALSIQLLGGGKEQSKPNNQTSKQVPFEDDIPF